MNRLVVPRWIWFAAGVLAAGVLAAAVYLPRLRRNLGKLRNTQQGERAAGGSVTQEPILTPTDMNLAAKLFWAAPRQSAALEAVEIQLPLSADPPLRARQLIDALIAGAPTAAQRTLPAATNLLGVYL